MIRRPFAAVPALAVLVACGNGTGPGAGTPGIALVAGNAQTDTIDAVLAQALRIEVRDSGGRRAPAQVVRFDVLPDTTYPLTLAPLAGTVYGTFVADSTDTNGQAGVVVRLGPFAGPARVKISVPAYGWVDTATFTIAAGNASSVAVQPVDTIVSIGASYQLRARVEDRHGNPRLNPVTYAAPDAPSATVTPTGMVTVHASGLWRILASTTGVLADTSWGGAIPFGTIVATTSTGVAIVDLGGSGYRPITIAASGGQGRYPTWLSPSEIAAQDGQSYPDLLRIDTGGAVTHLVPDTTTTVFELWPQASRDGAWIHFAGKAPNYSTSGLSLWRIQPNGTNLERVSPANVDGESETCPSPSPDGTLVVATTTRGGGSFQLAVINVATHVLTPLSAAGIQPRWAPAGDTIAYLGGPGFTEIWLISSSGGGARRASPAGHSYAFGIEWTPDRTWLIARSQVGMELIHVASGHAFPLAGLPGDLSQPAWKP